MEILIIWAYLGYSTKHVLSSISDPTTRIGITAYTPDLHKSIAILITYKQTTKRLFTKIIRSYNKLVIAKSNTENCK